MRRFSTAWLLTPLLTTALFAQAPKASGTVPAPADDPSKLSFLEYDPPSTLRVSEHPVPRARFPFVDVHSHQFDLDEAGVRQIVADMDAMNMAVMVNLSGRGFRRVTDPDGRVRGSLGPPSYLADLLALTERVARGRIVHFTNVDISQIGSPRPTA